VFTQAVRLAGSRGRTLAVNTSVRHLCSPGASARRLKAGDRNADHEGSMLDDELTRGERRARRFLAEAVRRARQGCEPLYSVTADGVLVCVISDPARGERLGAIGRVSHGPRRDAFARLCVAELPTYDELRRVAPGAAMLPEDPGELPLVA
jgi:hypothetical protein